MQHRPVKGGVGGVAVRLPILIGEIELDVSPNDWAAIDTDGGVGKIRAGFAIPSAELHHLDRLAPRAGKRSAKVAREPARLQFQLAEIARKREERALANFGSREKLRVTLGAGHLRQARIRCASAARWKTRLLASGRAGEETAEL